MTISEFVRYLKKQGIKLRSHGSKHDVYWNPKTGAFAQLIIEQFLSKWRIHNEVCLPCDFSAG